MMGSKKPGQGVLFGTMSIFAVGTYYVNEASFVGLIQKEQGDAAQNSIIKAKGVADNKPKSLIDSLGRSFFGSNRELTFSDWITTPEAVSAYEKWRLSEAGVRFLTEPYTKTPYYKTNLIKWSANQKRPFKEFFRISKNKSSYQGLFNDWKRQPSGFEYLRTEYEKTDEFKDNAEQWVKNGPGVMDMKTFFSLRDREPQYRDDYNLWRVKDDNIDELLKLWKTKDDYQSKKKSWLDERNKKLSQDKWVLTPDAASYYQNWKTGSSYQADTETGWKKTSNYESVLKTWIDVYPTKKSLEDYQDRESLWSTYFTNYKNSRAGNLEIEANIKAHSTYVTRKQTWSPTGKSSWLGSSNSNRFYNAWRTSTPGQTALKPLFEATAKYQEEKDDWITSSYTNKKSKDLWLAGLGSTRSYNAWKVTPSAVAKLQTKWIGDDDGDYISKRNAWIRANYNKRAKSVWATLDDATTKFNQWKAIAANQNKLKTSWETTADFTRKTNAWIDDNLIKRGKSVWLGLADAKAKYNRWRVSSSGQRLLKPIFNNLPVYVTARNRWLLSDKFTSKTPKNQWFAKDKDAILAKYNAWRVTDAGKGALTSLFQTKKVAYLDKKNAWLSDTTLNTKKRSKDYWKTTQDAVDKYNDWVKNRKDWDLKTKPYRWAPFSEATYWEQEGKTDFDKKFEDWKGTVYIPKISSWIRRYSIQSFNEWKAELRNTDSEQTKSDKRHVETYWKKEHLDDAAKAWSQNNWESRVEMARGSADKRLRDWKRWSNWPVSQSKPLPTYQEIKKEYSNRPYYGLDYKTWVPGGKVVNGKEDHSRIYTGYKRYLSDLETSARHWREKNYELLKGKWNTAQRRKTWGESNLKIFNQKDWITAGKDDLIAKYNAWKATDEGQNYLFEQYQKTPFYKAQLKLWFDTNKVRKSKEDWHQSPAAQAAFDEWKPTAAQIQDLEQKWKASADYTTKKASWVRAGRVKRGFKTWIEGSYSNGDYASWKQLPENNSLLKTDWEKSLAFTNLAKQWFNTEQPDLNTKTKWLDSSRADAKILAFVKNLKNQEVLTKFEASDIYNDKTSATVDNWLMSSFSPLEEWIEDNLNSNQSISDHKRYTWSFTKMEKLDGYVAGFRIKVPLFRESVKSKGYYATNKTLAEVLYNLGHYYLSLDLKWKEVKVVNPEFHKNATYRRALENSYNQDEARYKKVWTSKILGHQDYTAINADLKKHLIAIYKDYSGFNPDTNEDFKLYQKHHLGKKSNYIAKFKTWLKTNSDPEVISLGNKIYETYVQDQLKNDDSKYDELFMTWKNSDGKTTYQHSEKAKQDYANWNDDRPITTSATNYDSNYQYQQDLQDYKFKYYLTTSQAQTSYNSWIDQSAITQYHQSQTSKNNFASWVNDYEKNNLFQGGILAYLDSTKSHHDFAQWTTKETDNLFDDFSDKDKSFYNYYFRDDYRVWKHSGFREFKESDWSGSKKINYKFLHMSSVTTNKALLEVFKSNVGYWNSYWQKYHNRQQKDRAVAEAKRFYKSSRDIWIKDFNTWFKSHHNKKKYWDKGDRNPHSPMARHYKKWVDKGGASGAIKKDIPTYRKHIHYTRDLKKWLNAKKAGTDRTNWFWFYVVSTLDSTIKYSQWPDPIGEDDYHQTKDYKDAVKAFVEGRISRGDDERLGAYLTSDQSTTDYNAWIDLSGENSYQASDEYISDLNAWSLNADASFKEYSDNAQSKTDYDAWTDPNPIKRTQAQYKNSDAYATDFAAWKQVSDAASQSNEFKFYLTQGESTTHYNSWFDPIGETRYKANALFTRDYNAWETKAKGVGVYKDDPQSNVDYGAWIDPGGEGSYKASAAYLGDLNAWSADKTKGIGTYTTNAKSNADWATILDEEFAKTSIHTGLMTSLKVSESKRIYTESDRFTTDYNLWVDPLLRTEAKYLLTPQFKTNARNFYNTDAKVFALYQTTKTFEDDYDDWLGVEFKERDYLADDMSKSHLNLWSDIFKNGAVLYSKSKKPQDDLATFNLKRKRTNVKYLDSKEHFDSYKEYIGKTNLAYYDVWFYNAKFGENIYRTWDDPKGIEPDDEKYQVSEDYWKNLGVWSKNIVNGRSQFQKSPLGIHLFVNYKFRRRN